jgi:hypothetical protein
VPDSEYTRIEKRHNRDTVAGFQEARGELLCSAISVC